MIKLSKLENKTQADGAQTVSLEAFDDALTHQLHTEVSATPTAGTLTVSIKTYGASGFVDLTDTIDLTSIAVMQFTGYATEIQITPTGFDADKTYSIYIISGNRGNY